ncbi:MAG: choice-of-anchor T family protein [Candidatus Thermoplasmatota archaeon]
MKKISIIALAPFLIASSLGLINFINEPVSAQYIIPDRFFFEKVSEIVDVSPEGNRTAIFEGTLETSCEVNYTLRLELNKSRLPINWYAEVFPDYINRRAGVNSDNITVVIIVPPEESHSVVGVIKIQTYKKRADNETWYYSASATLSVSVAPYYKIAIACYEPCKEALPGGNVSFTLKIINQGNAPDNISINIENKEALKKMITNLPITLSIDEKETKNLTVNITLQEGMRGLQKIIINISSLSEPTVFERYSLYVLVGERKGVWLNLILGIVISLAIGLLIGFEIGTFRKKMKKRFGLEIFKKKTKRRLIKMVV